MSDLEGAHVFNLHGETFAMADVVAEIERARPGARITFDDTPLAIPSEFDGAAVRATVERFAQLQSEGRLDTSDLEQ